MTSSESKSVYQHVIDGTANFPGLKSLGTATYWGGCYCKICGDRDYEKEEPYYQGLVPRHVRFWDCDDGWKSGVLCKHCLDEVAHRGPKDDDYAVVTQANASNDEVVSAMADLLGDDADGLQSMLEDFNL
jgi:hypothetical protein